MTSVLEAVRDLAKREQLGAVLTIVAGPGVGSKAVVGAEATVIAGTLPPDILDDVLADALTLMEREQNRTLAYEDREVFIETLAPQPQLLIFGAGHIAQPLSRIARDLGFRVIVSDARGAWATDDRFPDVDQLIVGWPDQVLEQVELDRRTYVVLLSHDARFEDPVLPAVRHAPVPYAGALGSRRTARSRVERLTEAGWSEDEIARIHAPIGIDIGAEQPGEVALSILAEIIRVRYGHGTGTSLRGRQGRVHLQRGEEAGTG